jgi:predicted lipid carrier protein YhbT
MFAAPSRGWRLSKEGVMSRGDPRRASRQARVEVALKKLVGRAPGCRALRKSSIVIRTVGDSGRDYYIDCSPDSAKLTNAPLSPPTVEVIGDVRNIEGLLLGQKDPRKLFFAGGLRVRGDLRYLSNLATELGILKQPL